jgi:hypothetical protein
MALDAERLYAGDDGFGSAIGVDHFMDFGSGPEPHS